MTSEYRLFECRRHHLMKSVVPLLIVPTFAGIIFAGGAGGLCDWIPFSIMLNPFPFPLSFSSFTPQGGQCQLG
jgi:hypothetical protein